MSSHPTYDELHELGKQVKNKAIAVTLEYAQYISQTGSQMSGDPDAPDSRSNDNRDTPKDSSTGIPLTAAQKADITSYLDTSYSWIVPSFTQFSHPDPADADGMLQDLLEARTILAPGLADVKVDDVTKAGTWTRPTKAVKEQLDVPINERMNLLNGDVKGWHGLGAQAFNRHLLAPLKTSIDYQHDVVFMLAAGIMGHQKIHQHARKDIMNIGHTTVQVLDTLDPRPCHGGKALPVTLTVLAALAGIGAAVATGGTAIVLGIAGAAAGGAAGLFPGGDDDSSSAGKNHKIHGDSPAKVLSSMNRMIIHLLTDIDTVEKRVADKLNGASKVLHDPTIYANMVPPLTAANNFTKLGKEGIGGIDSPAGMYDS